MPRTSRQHSDTGVYHVMLRGIDRQDIFADDQDRGKLHQKNRPYFHLFIISRRLIVFVSLLFIVLEITAKSTKLSFNMAIITDLSFFESIDSIINKTPYIKMGEGYYVIDLLKADNEYVKYSSSLLKNVNECYSKELSVTLSQCPPLGNYVYIEYNQKKFILDRELAKDYHFAILTKRIQFSRNNKLSLDDLDYSNQPHWYFLYSIFKIRFYYYIFFDYCLRWDWKQVEVINECCESIDLTNLIIH